MRPEVKRNAAIVAQFMVFFALCVLATAFVTALSLEQQALEAALRGQQDLIGVLWPALRIAIITSGVFGMMLLIPTALVWWVAGRGLDRLHMTPGLRAALQGLATGLAAVLFFYLMVGGLVPTTLSGPVFGMLFGWLILRKKWWAGLSGPDTGRK